MGVVHLALDTRLDRHVALKRLHHEAAATQDQLDRFVLEARAAARIAHDNIVRVLDVGTEAGLHYFTMEYVEGECLEAAKTKLSTRRFVEIMRDVANGLHAMHEAGILHRDVKPANVLVDSGGRARVTDFGLARLVREEGANGLTRTGATMGTREYMSPEQAEGRLEDIDARSDVWSLGVMLYQHLTGNSPFRRATEGLTLRAVSEFDPPCPSRAARARRIHRDLGTICLKCLEKSRAQRYQSAADVSSDLQSFLNGEPILARPLLPGVRLARRAVKHKAIVLGATVAIVLLAAALLSWGTESRHVEVEKLLHLAQGLWTQARSLRAQAEPNAQGFDQKLAEALRICDRAIKQDPKYGWGYEHRGRIKLETADLDRAEADLAQAIKLLGAAGSKAARLSLARLCFERAAAVVPCPPEAIGDTGRRQVAAWVSQARYLTADSGGKLEWRGSTEELAEAERRVNGFLRWSATQSTCSTRMFRLRVDGKPSSPDFVPLVASDTPRLACLYDVQGGPRVSHMRLQVATDAAFNSLVWDTASPFEENFTEAPANAPGRFEFPKWTRVRGDAPSHNGAYSLAEGRLSLVAGPIGQAPRGEQWTAKWKPTLPRADVFLSARIRVVSTADGWGTQVRTPSIVLAGRSWSYFADYYTRDAQIPWASRHSEVVQGSEEPQTAAESRYGQRLGEAQLGGEWREVRVELLRQDADTRKVKLLRDGKPLHSGRISHPGVGDAIPEVSFSVFQYDSAGTLEAQIDDVRIASRVALSPPLLPGGWTPALPYAGPSLARGTVYFWRVLFLDEAGAESAWTEAGRFETEAAGDTDSPAAPSTASQPRSER